MCAASPRAPFQWSYFHDNSTYYSGAIPSAVLTHDPSTGVTLSLLDVSDTGWAGTAAHLGTAKTWTIFVGTAPPLAPEAACS